MPIHYRIDPQRRLLLSSFPGSVGPDDILAFYDELRADPDFGDDTRQLADFRESTPPEWPAEAMRRVLARDPFGPGARRAFVGPDDLVYALARMFASHAAMTKRGGEVRAFRTMEEARRWLEEDPPDTPSPSPHRP